MDDRLREGKIKVLFPKNVETITISKNDYDRLYGELTYENIELKEKINKIKKIIENNLFIAYGEEQSTINICFWEELQQILNEGSDK